MSSSNNEGSSYIKAAYIAGLFGVIAAVIAGIFLLANTYLNNSLANTKTTGSSSEISAASTQNFSGLFVDNFDNGDVSKWKNEMEVGSQGRVESGQFVLDGTGVIVAGSNIWENYSVKAKVKILSEGDVDFGIFARAKDSGTLYLCQQWHNEVWLGRYGNSLLRLDTGSYQPRIGEFYEVRMDVQENVIKCYANGLEVASAKDIFYSDGRFGFRVVDMKVAIDDVEVFPLP